MATNLRETVADSAANGRGQPAAGPVYKVIGTRPIRHDGADKVTGRAIYGDDLQLAGMLHGKILRSPHAHARIKRIEPRPLKKCRACWPWSRRHDLPEPARQDRRPGRGPGEPGPPGRELPGHQKALYKGHAVAAVAAVSPHVAEEAAEADSRSSTSRCRR